MTTPSLDHLLGIATMHVGAMVGPPEEIGVTALTWVGMTMVEYVDRHGLNPIFRGSGMRFEMDINTWEFTVLEGDTNRPKPTAGSGEVEWSAASVDRLTLPNSRTDPA